MSVGFPKGVSSLSSRASLLGRANPNTETKPLSPIQSEVDSLVGSAVSTVSDEKMMVSLFAAGAAARFIRVGTVAASGNLSRLAVQAMSHATALAGESAVFAGMERRFAQWEGRTLTQSFQKDWARAAISLGSIKFFGGPAKGQNLIAQHLLIDAGMVGGQHLEYAFGVTDRPSGRLAQQMIHAEGMNLGMKGSLALLHGFSPRFSALEQSVDLALRSYETKPFSENPPISISPRLIWAAEGNLPTSEVPNSVDDSLFPSKPVVVALLSTGVGGEGGPKLEENLNGEEWNHKTEQRDGITAASHSGIGYTPHNEDRYFFAKKADGRSFLMTTDGLGGHDDGEVAAEIVRRAFEGGIGEDLSIPEIMERAHQAILAYNREDYIPSKISNFGRFNPGAVAVALEVRPLGEGLFRGEFWTVGDSEAIVLRISPQDESFQVVHHTTRPTNDEFERKQNGEVFGKTPDGRLALEDLFEHRQIYYQPVESFLGAGDGVVLHHQGCTLQAGDIVIVGSDGFFDNFGSHEVIGKIITQSGAKTASEIHEALFQEALIRMALLEIGNNQDLSHELYVNAY